MAILRPGLAGMSRLEELDLSDVPMRRQAELAELLRMLPSLRRLHIPPCRTWEKEEGTPMGQWLEVRAALQQQFPHVQVV